MLFHSIEFLIFFFVVYFLYVILSFKWQNCLLLAASYVFYGFWDWRFLSLIWVSTIVDYFCAIKIENANDPKRRIRFLGFSLIVNLGLLGIFKYFDFFTNSFIDLLSLFGFSVSEVSLNIILPIGISFYTFQSLSYTIDVYQGKLKSTDRFLDFALYVSFFPQLIAGPIERAQHLLPQILKPRKILISEVKEGAYLFAWGLFEKIFIANNLAQIVDPIFAKSDHFSSMEVLVAGYAFAFQIFADFDGYSNMARGLGKCLGIDIMVNFNLPYFAKNPRDFWRRWHISLSTWLRDYLYIPLGGNRSSANRNLGNLMIVMLLGGLWHGASWTFILWGAYHGFLLIAHRFITLKFPSKNNHCVTEVFKCVGFFHLVVIGWVIFRAESVSQVMVMMQSVFLNHSFDHNTTTMIIKLICILLPLWIIQIWQHQSKNLMVVFQSHWLLKYFVMAVLFYLFTIWGVFDEIEFIYFQF